MTALIDADSIVYIIGWNYKEMGTESEVKQSCDNFLRDILTLTQADDYIGVFSPPSEVTFRFEAYRYARYKGNRPEKPEFIVKWEKIIKDHFTEVHGFFTDPWLEADDVIAGIADMWQRWPQTSDKDPQGLGFTVPHIICSPDKDLKQIPGSHFDYRAKAGEEIKDTRVWISHSEAYWNFWTQMLTGDGNDNVAGVPGLGDVKARKIIDELKESGDTMQVKSVVLSKYCKYFGEFYGPMIFRETELAICLVHSPHPYYKRFSEVLRLYASTRRKKLVANRGFFDLTS